MGSTESQNGNMWKISDEAGDLKPLNSEEGRLPVEAAFPAPVKVAFPILSDRINPQLPEETLMAFPKAVAM